MVTGHPGGREPAGYEADQPAESLPGRRPRWVGLVLRERVRGVELESQGGETSLTGWFADQAQLHGLLDRLRDLGIPIVSVNPVE